MNLEELLFKRKKELETLFGKELKEIKQHRINLRFFRHPKKIIKAKASMKRLRTIAKTNFSNGETLEKNANIMTSSMNSLSSKANNQAASLEEI